MNLSKPIQPQIQNLTVHRRVAEAAEKKQKFSPLAEMRQ
jgi:hypothetical protein